MILFLDFDGVLHPSEVYVRGRTPELRTPEHTLFEHAGLLSELLISQPHVRIVLSTSWVWALGFQKAKSQLPGTLQDRIKGATWHSSFDYYEWQRMTRYEQIDRYVCRHNLKDWIALDDNAEGWPEEHQDQLIHTDEIFGLGEPAKQEELVKKLIR